MFIRSGRAPNCYDSDCGSFVLGIYQNQTIQRNVDIFIYTETRKKEQSKLGVNACGKDVSTL